MLFASLKFWFKFITQRKDCTLKTILALSSTKVEYCTLMEGI